MLDSIELPKAFRPLLSWIPILYDIEVIIHEKRTNGMRRKFAKGRIVNTKNKMKILELTNGVSIPAPNIETIQEGNIIELYRGDYHTYYPCNTIGKIVRDHTGEMLAETALEVNTITTESLQWLGNTVVNINRDYATRGNILTQIAPFITIFLVALGITFMFYVYMNNVATMVAPMNALATSTERTAGIISQWISSNTTNAIVTNGTIAW